MSVWSVYGTGLILRDEEIDNLLEEAGYDDIWDFISDNDELEGCYHDDDEDGLTCAMLDDDIEMYPGRMLCIPLAKEASLFRGAYANMEEIVEEVMNGPLGDYIDERFAESHIGKYSVVCHD